MAVVLGCGCSVVWQWWWCICKVVWQKRGVAVVWFRQWYGICGGLMWLCEGV